MPKPSRSLWLVGALGLVVLTGAPRIAGAKGRKIYLQLDEVREPKKTTPSLEQKARALFMGELDKSDRVVTKLADPAPRGEKLAALLKARHLAGYGLVLRITKVDHAMHPPPRGKGYKVLMAEVSVAVDAEKIPTSQMALAGQGTAQVGTEVRRFNEKERRQLVREALAAAVKQAADKTIQKLTTSQRERKRRGRRRGRRRSRR